MKIYLFLMLFFCAFANADEGHVGEIRYSILTPEQFRDKYGEEWELMQGQTIPSGSELIQLWGKPKVPDVRGVFLRCSQAGRNDKKGNPVKKLAIGAYQDSEFKSHTHIDEGHTHHDAGHAHGITACGNDGGCGSIGQEFPRNDGHFATHIGHANIQVGQAKIKSNGGLETRPQCVIVNAFIKLKESNDVTPSQPTPSEQTQTMPPQQPITTEITPQMMREITTRPEFQTAVQAAAEDAVRDIMGRINR